MIAEVNGYQRTKAKTIADYLTTTLLQTSLTPHQLCKVVAIMPMREWQTVSFAAGVPTADLECKAEVLRILRERV